MFELPTGSKYHTKGEVEMPNRKQIPCKMEGEHAGMTNTMQNDRFQLQTVGNIRHMVVGKKSKK